MSDYLVVVVCFVLLIFILKLERQDQRRKVTTSKNEELIVGSNYREKAEAIVRKDKIEASIRKKFIELYVNIGSELAVIALFEEAPKELFECIGLSQWIEIYRKAPENSEVQKYATSKIKTIEDPDLDKYNSLISWYFYEGVKSESRYNTLHEAILERISRLNRDVEFWCRVCLDAAWGRYLYFEPYSKHDTYQETKLYEIEKGGLLSTKLFNVAYGKIIEATKEFNNNFEKWWDFWKVMKEQLEHRELSEKKISILRVIQVGLFNSAKSFCQWGMVYNEFLRDDFYSKDFYVESTKFQREVLKKLSS